MSLFTTNSSQQFDSSSSDEYAHKRLRVAILGSSGSIGTQTLDVCLQHRDKIDVVALSVYNSCDALVKAARTCDAQHVVVVDETHKNDAILDNLPATCSCEFGPQAVSYTHLRAHETPEHLVCRLLLEKKKKKK